MSVSVLSALLVPLLLVQAQTPTPPQVEKLPDGRYRVREITVDPERRELSVPGIINQEMGENTVLEFVANVAGWGKAYETAVAAKTDAVAFNTALLLLGLDPKHARVPTHHFDPVQPQGDPVEVLIEWRDGDAMRRVPVEELMWDRRTNATMKRTPWVYTGSSFLEGRFMAALDGVLIGFVHSPSPLIENQGDGAVGAFGSVVFNTRVGLAPGDSVTLIVRALPKSSRRKN